MDGGTGDGEILLLAGVLCGAASLNNLMSQLLQVAEAASRQVGRPSPIRGEGRPFFSVAFFSFLFRREVLVPAEEAGCWR